MYIDVKYILLDHSLKTLGTICISQITHFEYFVVLNNYHILTISSEA